MCQVVEINLVDELEQYQACWQRLLRQTVGASFFQSLEWLRCYAHHFGQGHKWRVLVMVEDGRTIGILPLVVVTERTRVGRVRLLTYPLRDWSTFYGPIGPDASATLLAGLGTSSRPSGIGTSWT